MAGVSLEPEQPTHTGSLLYYLGCLGVICCILCHLRALGEPTFQLTGYNTKNGPQDPSQIISSWGDSSLNPMLSPRTLLPAAPWGGLLAHSSGSCTTGSRWGRWGWRSGERSSPDCAENGKSEMERKRDKTFLRTPGTANGGK